MNQYPNKLSANLVTIYPATEVDSQSIWQWRNEEVTRNMSAKTAIVAWESHQEWFKHLLEDPSRHLFVGHSGGDKVGMCRFDMDFETGIADVSINLNPQFRGQGLSSTLLSKAIKKFSAIRKVPLGAMIRKTNISSNKCFLRCGFEVHLSDQDYVHYRYFFREGDSLAV